MRNLGALSSYCSLIKKELASISKNICKIDLSTLDMLTRISIVCT